MADAASRAHHLHVAGFGAALVAERVLVRDRAFADIGDDLHVGMGMRRKAAVRRDLVVVPDAKRAMIDVFRIVIVGEGEVMLRLEPAVVGAAERVEWFQCDHGDVPFTRFSDFVQAPKPPSTLSTVPVTNEASGLARKTTPAAISSAVPKRCSACCVRVLTAITPPSFGFLS